MKKELSIILISIFISFIVALLGSYNGLLVNGVPVIFHCLLITYGIQFIVFIPSYIFTTEKFFDLTGMITYLSLMASPEYSMDTETLMLGSDAWMDAFLGMVPGSMGETSALACLIGAIVLVITKIGSWRTMVGCAVGTVFMALILNGFASEGGNPMLAVPFYWHFVVGGWAFGAIFMATDPVSSPFTERGKFIYGFFIGLLVVLIRCVNPAYAEGMMLAILFMNMFAPFIDHFFVQANIKRRAARYAA